MVRTILAPSKPIKVFFARQSRPEEYREQGDERLINAYAEMMGDGRDARMRVRMSPGLTAFSTSSDDIGCRGAILSGDYLYVVFDSGAYKIDSAGARTAIGHISGTGPVTMALNKVGQIGVVNKLGRYYVIDTATDTIQQVNTSDIGEFNSICFIGQRFALTLPDGSFYITEPNDALSINGLNQADAEGSPDGLVGGTELGNELYLLGTDTIEVWADTGAPPPGTPFARQGSSWINKGCRGIQTVVHADNTIFWIDKDWKVLRNDSYRGERVSHEGVERDIKRAFANGLEVRGGSYSIDGHDFIVYSCADFTWALDLKERRWHERKSKNLNRWKADVFVNAFGKWLVGTIDDGNLYEIDMDTTLEGSDLMVTIARSVFMGEAPDRANIYSAEIDFITGRASLTGTVPQTNPRWELRYSDDGGAEWTNPRQLELGTQGQYSYRCIATRLGRTGSKAGRIWELSGSDPHPRSFRKMMLYTKPLYQRRSA